MKRFGILWWIRAPFALALVLLSRILRPFVLIRFGNLRNHTIGTLSLHADGYMADRDMGLLPARSIDLQYGNAHNLSSVN